MTSDFSEFRTRAVLKLGDEEMLENLGTGESIGLFTFIWTKGGSAGFKIDGEPVILPANSILSLTPIQHVKFLSGSGLRIYQFNREFYCIKDHDKEVGCAGLLFFGNEQIPVVHLTEKEQEKFELLHQVFLDELSTRDNIQAEMLRMLMARLIIKITRIMKEDRTVLSHYESGTDMLRNFNLLVDTHFRTEHSVAFYAGLMDKSPKTLSNVFRNFDESPLKIIHERIVLEAKRQLLYSNKSAKEIAYEVGFDDASHLSRLFKKITGLSPSHFRQQARAV